MNEKNRTVALLLAAVVCFAVATLIALNDLIHGGNYPAWVAGGLVALAAAAVSERFA